MISSRAVVALAVLCLILSAAAPGNAASFDRQGRKGDGIFGVELAGLNGHTTYHISSYDTSGNGVESELEFPLKTLLAGLQGGYIGKDDQGRDAFRIGLQWLMNVDNGSGQLQDSDWMTDQIDITNVGSAHPGKDIFSLSDITSKALILDLHGSLNSWVSDSVAIGPLGGLRYERFQFDASNLSQVGYGPYAAGYTGTMPGPVLTYEVTYLIPYVGIHSEFAATPEFRASVDLSVSPLVSAKDRDDHLLRGKLVEGSTTGTAYGVAAAAAWDIGNNDSLGLSGRYLRISTTGSQTQTWYRAEGTIPAGTVITGINDKITSQQTFVSLVFTHRF